MLLLLAHGGHGSDASLTRRLGAPSAHCTSGLFADGHGGRPGMMPLMCFR